MRRAARVGVVGRGVEPHQVNQVAALGDAEARVALGRLTSSRDRSSNAALTLAWCCLAAISACACRTCWSGKPPSAGRRDRCPSAGVLVGQVGTQPRVGKDRPATGISGRIGSGRGLRSYSVGRVSAGSGTGQTSGLSSCSSQPLPPLARTSLQPFPPLLRMSYMVRLRFPARLVESDRAVGGDAGAEPRLPVDVGAVFGGAQDVFTALGCEGPAAPPGGSLALPRRPVAGPARTAQPGGTTDTPARPRQLMVPT